MKTFLKVLLVLALGCGMAWAGENASASAKADPTPSSKPAAAPTVEAPSISFGFQERIRTEDWNNITDMNSANDDERRQMRYRTRLWFNYKSSPLDVNVGVVDEVNKKYALKPADVTADRFNSDEVIFETLNLKLKNLGVPGLTFTFGRQDIQRGEGFILFDGTSGDGSRTQYFNAAVLTYTRNKQSLDIIGILDPRQDRFLGIIHDQRKYMNEWDEQAVGAYYTNRQRKDTDVDAYYFHKKEIHDYRAATNVQFRPDRHIETLGARAVRRLPQGYSVTGEFAGQWGEQRANTVTGASAMDIRAWGGYVYGKKTFATSWKPYVQVGFWALSGDDPKNASTLNGFDPIFSRWPKWSELEIYSLVPERGVAYWTNNKMLQIEGGISPTKKLNLRATFYEQYAFHPYTLNAKLASGTGTHRGENYQVRGDYTFNPRWKCHALFESFAPGDFYTNKSSAFFVQAQVLYTFNRVLVSFK